MTDKIFKDRSVISFYLEKDAEKALDEIRLREAKSKSEIVRLATLDYIKAHAEGNDSFKIDQWINNPALLAVPNTMSRKEDWASYVSKEHPKELQKLGNQIDFIRSEINQKLGLNDRIKEKEELRLAKQRISDKFRHSCDIRNKDPSKMKLWEYERWKAIMKSQEDNQQAKALLEQEQEKLATASESQGQGAPNQIK